MKHSKFAINALAASKTVGVPLVAKVDEVRVRATNAFRDHKEDLVREDILTRWRAANTVRCQFCDQAKTAGREMCKFHTAKLDHDFPELTDTATRVIDRNWREAITWMKDQLGNEDSAIIDILTMDVHPSHIRISATDGASIANQEV